MTGRYEDGTLENGAVCEVSRILYGCTNTIANACNYTCAGEPLA